MPIQAIEASLEDVAPWRDLYRQEMNCQIIHDSIHRREGWTREYLLREGETTVGYGSLAVAGPWKDRPTLYEFHVAPPARSQSFALFEELLSASGAMAIETQSNDVQLTVMLHLYATAVESESILFHDRITTHHAAPEGARLRPAMPEDAAALEERKLDAGAGWVIDVQGTLAASGGILFHYNRPYGDIFMSVAPEFRRRGLGSYLVQELKRVCYENGDVPAARCNRNNLASRRTLQRAGFVPCGHLLVGAVAQNGPA